MSVTAVEINADIANVYKTLYPKDIVIIGDAHEYLRQHYKEFDFIWTSPPCQTHSSIRQNLCVKLRNTEPQYPDMKLYQEIIFLQYNATCRWVVENVKPYYQPLILPTKELQRHYFWSNFPIPQAKFKTELLRKAQIADLEKVHGIDLSQTKIKNKRQILRNCVLPELGYHIYMAAINKQIERGKPIYYELF